MYRVPAAAVSVSVLRQFGDRSDLHYLVDTGNLKLLLLHSLRKCPSAGGIS